MFCQKECRIPRKNLFTCANRYIQKSNWFDWALLKFCLCAAGVLIGLAMPSRFRKTTAFTAMGLFVVTYIPLMCKFLKIVRQPEESNG